jgi:hypothetical protein
MAGFSAGRKANGRGGAGVSVIRTFLMLELGKAIMNERISQARGGRGLQEFLSLEFRSSPPPTPIPRRWTRRGYVVRAGVRGRLRGLVEAVKGLGAARPKEG